jgi:hypothetical protein
MKTEEYFNEGTLFESMKPALSKGVVGAGLTCNSCEHRQRWECNSKVFQYCGVRKSNRTDNGLLKIKCKDAACPLYEPCR